MTADTLHNYRQLVEKIDSLCPDIASQLGERLQCHAGCSSCCTVISVFPVEAAAIRNLLETLPEQQRNEIRAHAAGQSGSDSCPLLRDGLCLLYEVRPVICRTHGLPIVYTEDGNRISDCCPRNLDGMKSLSGTQVVNLDTLNTLLVAVNANYLASSGNSPSPTRLTLAEVVCTDG